MTDSRADPRCALWDETGMWVVCNRRWPNGKTPVCPEPLLRLNRLHDDWGNSYRTLVFPHDEWGDSNDVWVEKARARTLRATGRAPAPRRYGLGPRIGEPAPVRGPVGYPADVRCPGCGHKRLLDSGVLDVLTREEAERGARQRAQAEGRPDDGRSLLRDDCGRPADLLPRLRAAQRRGQRSAERVFASDRQEPLEVRVQGVIAKAQALLDESPPGAVERLAEARTMIHYAATRLDSLSEDPSA